MSVAGSTEQEGPPPLPPSGIQALIRLTRIAVAAGECRLPIAIGFSGFSVVELTTIWRRIQHDFSPGQVRSVHRPVHIRRITEGDESGRPRLILVFQDALLEEVAWTSILEAKRLPAILFRVATLPRAESAIPSLTISPTRELRDQSDWAGRGTRDPGGLRPPPATVSVPGIFADELSAKLPSAADQDVVQALLVGVASLCARDPGEAVVVGHQHYREVRRLLVGLAAGAGTKEHDALTVAMVSRANAYLRLTSRNTAAAQSGEHGCLSIRTVGDLGDQRSHALLGLVEALRAEGRFDVFRQLGLLDELLRTGSLEGLDARGLAQRLLPWSLKQTRDRFDKLRREGWIDAARPSANGPIMYRVPESLFDRRSPFHALAPDLEARDHAGDTPQSAQALTPA